MTTQTNIESICIELLEQLDSKSLEALVIKPQIEKGNFIEIIEMIGDQLSGLADCVYRRKLKPETRQRLIEVYEVVKQIKD